MYKKAFLALSLFFVSMLIVATLDTFWLHGAKIQRPAQAPLVIPPEDQLKQRDPSHPLLDMYALAAQSPQAALSQLAQWQQDNPDVKPIETVYVLWTARRAASDDDERAALDKQLSELAQKNQLHWLQAWVAQARAKVALRAGDLEAARTAIVEGATVAQKHHVEFLLTELYNTAGVVFNATNELVKAQQYFLKGIKQVEAWPDDRLHALLHNNLGLLYVHLEQWQNALKYLSQAETLYGRYAGATPEYMSMILLNQSFAHNRAGQVSQSREKFEQALSYLTEDTGDFYRIVALKNEARLLNLEKDLDGATQKATRCISMTSAEHYPMQHGICWLELGFAHYAGGKIDAAQSATQSAVAVFSQLNHTRWLLKSRLFLAQVLESQGQAAAALALLKEVRVEEKAMIMNELVALDTALEVQQIAQERDLLSAQSRLSNLELLLDKQRFRLLVLWLILAFTGAGWLALRARAVSKDNRRLYDLSFVDPLTKAANRRLYQQEMTKPKRLRTDALYRLVVIDLDHFKQINDSYGHDKGDGVLAEAATRLQKFVADDELFVRWGGEEFLMVAKERDDFQAFSQNMVNALRDAPFKLGDITLRVTASFGVSHAMNVQQLGASDAAFKCADQCLYQAKSNGRDQVVMPEATQ
ncbi:diguanylate cyclase [Pseudoalteromonas sp. DL2-H2.2]|uniref:tetratricopeptide repeat-containing diguanylate cyclase n=1 Tax=Pseudoalteromonas sp. DL2-H2.2 TaxID=2908889 RepID=UPI001F4821A0|nr:tetratricopeptide repeat-containing diguanylate cyclase [Pseudoalteromonas sp. DL2-H2.2]MCF2909915.1 diguanylate cyclase [Pseudoalteromonas sp. DL2-H2.2]